MKHILNNLTEEEKNSIREQYTGKLKVNTEDFQKLVESKLGDVKPLNEQSFDKTGNIKVGMQTPEVDKNKFFEKVWDSQKAILKKILKKYEVWIDDQYRIEFKISPTIIWGFMPDGGGFWYQNDDKFKIDTLYGDFSIEGNNLKIKDDYSDAEWNSSKGVWSKTPKGTPEYTDWLKAKDVLTKTGFEGVKGTVEVTENGTECVSVEIGEYSYYFLPTKNAYINKGGKKFGLTKWSLENDQVIIKEKLKPTKSAKGYAETEEDITSGNKILGLGSRGDLVKKIQYEIFSYSEGKQNPGCKADAKGPEDCDGIYGPKTKQGVKIFQEKEGLSKDGNVGKETWTFMTTP